MDSRLSFFAHTWRLLFVGALGCGGRIAPVEGSDAGFEAGPTRCGEPDTACASDVDCCTAVCSSGRCAVATTCVGAPAVVASLPPGGRGVLAQSPSRLFWTVGAEVWAIPKQGGSPSVFARDPDGLSIKDFAVDGSGVYWTTKRGRAVGATLDGVVHVIGKELTEYVEPEGIFRTAPVTHEGLLYWSANYTYVYGFESHSLMRAPIAGPTAPTDYFALPGQRGVHLVGTAAFLYWIDPYRHTLQRLSYDVGGRGTAVASNVRGPLFAADGGVYFSIDYVTQFAKDGGPVRALSEPRAYPDVEAFTEHGRYVYVPTGGKGVWRIPKDGGTASPVAGLETFTASAVLSDDGCIYARGKVGETDHVLRVAYPKD